MPHDHDHFHCQFEHDGQLHEIEGGFTGYPRDWKDRTDQQRKAWWDKILISWGMPDGAVVKRLWLAR